MSGKCAPGKRTRNASAGAARTLAPAARVFGRPDPLDVVVLGFVAWLHMRDEVAKQLAEDGCPIEDCVARLAELGPQNRARRLVLRAAELWRAHHPDVDEGRSREAAAVALQLLRVRFGGTSFRIPGAESQWSKRIKVQTELLAATARGEDNIEGVFRRAGVSRATGYRILGSRGSSHR